MNRPHVAEFICSIRTASHPAVSPAGDRVVYIVSDVDPETLETRSWLTLSNLDGSGARRITSPGTTPSSPNWDPDGEGVVYVAGLPRETGFGIFRLSLQGGEAQELGRFESIPSELAFAPDGRSIAFVAPHDPDERDANSRLAPVRVVTRVDYKEDGYGIPNESQYQVFVIDLESAGFQRWTDGRFDHSALQWSPDGKTLAAIRRQRVGLKSQLLLLDIAGRSQRKIGHPDQVVRGFKWSPDGRSLAIAHLSFAEYSANVRVLDVASGETRILTEGMDWCPDYAPNLLAWDGNGHLIASGFEAARSALWSLDTVKGTVTRILLEDSYRSGLASAPGSSVVVQNRGSATSTAELVVTDTTTRHSTPLTQLNTAWFESHPPGSIEQHEVTNEGFSVSFLLKTPHDFDPSRTYPVVFEIHGGPHMFRGYDIETSNQLLLDAGYLVVCPNPRGSISWGLEYTKGVLGDWGGGDWRDILAVVDEVAAMPFVDETRLGIYGYSYGGYMSSWAIGQTDRFKAAVIGAPLTDLISRDGTSDIGYAASWLEYNGELPDIREKLVRQSPVTHMHKAVTPTLILHPEDDQRCPIGQGEQLFVGLKRAGVETEFVRYPDESHLMPWYGPAEYRIDFYTRILDWFEKYLWKAANTNSTQP